MLTDKEIETARTLCEFEQEGPWARQFLSRALDQIDQLRADLAASQREVERLHHGEATAEDGVCPDAVEVVKLRAEVERLRKIVIGFVADLFLDHESEMVKMHDHDTDEEHDALRYLASIGRVEIVSEQGRRVVARWK